MGEMADMLFDDMFHPDWEWDDCDDGWPTRIRKVDRTKWRTREGVVMNIKDMTDGHLHNAIAYSERRGNLTAVEILTDEKIRRENLEHVKRIKADKVYAAFHAGWKGGYNYCAHHAWPEVGISIPVTMKEAWENFVNQTKAQHEPETIQRGTTERNPKSIRRNKVVSRRRIET